MEILAEEEKRSLIIFMINHECETLYYSCINEELLVNGLCSVPSSFYFLTYIYIHVPWKFTRTHLCLHECVVVKLLIAFFIWIFFVCGFCLFVLFFWTEMFEREIKQGAHPFSRNPAALRWFLTVFLAHGYWSWDAWHSLSVPCQMLKQWS